MNELRGESVAKRLGLPDALICRLQARGLLQRLDLPKAEIGEQLYNAHRAFVLAGRRRRGQGELYRPINVQDLSPPMGVPGRCDRPSRSSNPRRVSPLNRL